MSIASWRQPRTAIALTGLVVALYATFGVLYLSPVTPGFVSREAGGATTAVFVLPFSTFALTGGLIAARRPRNPIGWLLIGGAGLLATGALCSLIGTLLLVDHSETGRWVLLGGTVWAGGPTPATFLLGAAILLFPDGALPSPRWRRLLYLSGALMVFNTCVALTTPGQGVLGIAYVSDPHVNATSPFAIAGLAGFNNEAGSVLAYVNYPVQLAAVVSVFLRLRGATAERRQQIKWFGFGVTTTIVLIALTNFLPSPVSPSAAYVGFFIALTAVAGLATPVTAGVAIFKYRLYDIDIIISRALVYGSLAVLITGVYVGIAVGIGELAGSGGKPNLGLSILATAIVAVGFQPARERLQRVANRLVYGKRSTPYQVLSQFSSQVAGSYAADEVLPHMARVLEEGTAAERSTVWVRSGAALHAAATWPAVEGAEPQPAVAMLNGTLPALPAQTRAVEVRHQGELLGALSVEKRRGESLTPVEEKLLDDLAHQAGLVLKNVGLTADLQLRLEELRASRQRLVSAQDAERRKLERNLHDGAQQHLVALKVKLGLAEMLAGKDPEKARATISQLKADADEALETLRDLARGIYPPLLAEKGLPAALASQARKATVPVTVDADGVGRYPQDVEATVYFCVLEALQNVQKYARASAAVVRLREVDGDLSFEVDDDGRGFDVDRVKRGSGLTNMHDRIDAVGGRLEITSAPNQGSRVAGVLPVPVDPASDQTLATAVA